MSLRAAFNEFKVAAKRLEREEGIKYDAKPAKDTIAKLLDGYCLAKDNNDTYHKDMYIAGLMLRFWYVIGKLEASCPRLGLQDGDFMSWLYEAIEYACKYRAWQKGHVNAQQCVNQCIETIRKQHYYEYNLDKHRANYNITSMDTTMDEDGKITLNDTLLDESEEDYASTINGSIAARQFIQMYLNKNKVVEAIILDTIAFNDSQKLVKKVDVKTDENGNKRKVINTTSEFWAFKVIQALNQLPEDYEKYFLSEYKINPDAFKAAIEAVKKANNTKLYRYLNNTLKDARVAVGATL